jgi:hypothetical protein
MKKPTFFLSSTIYDFADLRSAVKYFLEQQGCAVLASEYNDFNKPLDMHSYQSCLDSIRQADYFILFVGSRIGGWFDKASRISITQREYREAYELHKIGTLKLINFVRADIWQLREDRNALVRYLDTLVLDEGTKQKIVNYPTKHISDASFIIDFIAEVGRNKDTKAASAIGKAFPSGNWLHVFHVFKDIMDLLQTQVFSGQPIEEAAIKRLLRHELIEILRACLIKLKSGVFSPRAYVERFHEQHNLTMDSRGEEDTRVKIDIWNQLSILSIGLLRIRLHPLILSQALSSMTFLKFDSGTGTFQEEPVYEALYLLQEEIRLFELANKPEILQVVFANTPRVRGHGVDPILIKTFELIGLLHIFDRWINIIELSKSIIKYLDDDFFQMPKLRGKSPIPDMNPQLEAESVTISEVQQFINID